MNCEPCSEERGSNITEYAEKSYSRVILSFFHHPVSGRILDSISRDRPSRDLRSDILYPARYFADYLISDIGYSIRLRLFAGYVVSGYIVAGYPVNFLSGSVQSYLEVQKFRGVIILI